MRYFDEGGEVVFDPSDTGSVTDYGGGFPEDVILEVPASDGAVSIGGLEQFLQSLFNFSQAPAPVEDANMQAVSTQNSEEVPYGQTLKPMDYSPERINAALAAYAQQGVPSSQTAQSTGAAKPTGSEALGMIKDGDYLKGIEALLGSSLGKALFAGGLGLASFVDAKNQNPRDLTKGTEEAWKKQMQKPSEYPTYYYPGKGGLASLNRTTRPLA